MQKYIPKLLIVLLTCPTYSCSSGSQADIYILSSMTRCWNKSSPNFSQSCPNVATAVFTWKVDVFEEPRKSPYIWANFKRNLDTNNYQKSSNLVTLILRLKKGFIILTIAAAAGVVFSNEKGSASFILT